ncbi:LuxR C-terminal-related transcriptional regulator [Gillisia limnaea]|uniref:Transcriptional regulator, LuxR family n=2 Tax=Gillisia TaxID=244698 RepID=H2BSC9_GILLR|nr:transcriptional regulator, LuxR family [Gillisia limnaea DSM 15749]
MFFVDPPGLTVSANGTQILFILPNLSLYNLKGWMCIKINLGMKTEKKHLLIISSQKKLTADLKEGLSVQFVIHAVNSLHTGYSTALKLLPDIILIDQTSLNLKGLRNLGNFRSTHFLKKSHLIIYGEALERTLIEETYNDLVDQTFYTTISTACLCDELLEFVSNGRTLTNYWKDAFLGLFNIMENPVVLLQQENIIAMNDAFKHSFKVHKTDGLKLTDFVHCENKAKVKTSLRNFSKGKHMQANTKTSLRLSNGKIREAKISFSKLDRMIDGQFIMMIHYSENLELSDQVGSKSDLVEKCFEENSIQTTFNFSKREKEIILLLCKGYKTKEISETLFISPKTIEKHRANIIKRTNSDTILESIIYAINHDLINVKVT